MSANRAVIDQTAPSGIAGSGPSLFIILTSIMQIRDLIPKVLVKNRKRDDLKLFEDFLNLDKFGYSGTYHLYSRYLNILAQLSSGAIGPNLSPTLHLHPFQRLWRLRLYVVLSEPSLPTYRISTKVSC